MSKAYSTGGDGDTKAVIAEVMGWLAQPDNTDWLVVFDNVDREYSPRNSDPGSYDVRKYFSGTDHGSILITTRLARLEQLGDARRVNRVDQVQAQAILETWYKSKYGELSLRLYS
jgi:hypothetical protein